MRGVAAAPGAMASVPPPPPPPPSSSLLSLKETTEAPVAPLEPPPAPLAAAAAAPAAAAVPPVVEARVEEAEYVLVWEDDFRTPGLPEGSKWSYQVEANNWVHDRNHNEVQWYMSHRMENSRCRDGRLELTAKQEDWQGAPLTSARIRTKGKGDWLYGKFEVRATLPAGRPGIWPAIWLMPSENAYGPWPHSGEIDIMECVGWQPEQVHASVHTGAFNHRKKSHKHAETTVRGAHEAYHVYGVEWTEARLRYTIDGAEVFVFDKARNATAAEWPFDQKFHLILNVAVGGNWGGHRGIDLNALPATMYVDYVKVYQRPPNSPPPPPPPFKVANQTGASLRNP